MLALKNPKPLGKSIINEDDAAFTVDKRSIVRNPFTVQTRLLRARTNLNFDFWWKYYSRARTIKLAENEFPTSSIEMMQNDFSRHF